MKHIEYGMYLIFYTKLSHDAHYRVRYAKGSSTQEIEARLAATGAIASEKEGTFPFVAIRPCRVRLGD